MRSEEVPLRLQEVCRETLATVAVVVLERGAKTRSRHSVDYCLCKDVAPAALGLGELAAEIRVEQDVGDVRIVVECFLDFAEEYAADDAAASPHQGNSSVVEVPAVFLCGRLHKGITLGIGNHLGSEKCLSEVLKEGFSVSGELCRSRSLKYLGSRHALFLLRGKAAGKYGLTNERKRNAGIKR